MKERIAIISGYRSPMTKAQGALKKLTASELGARIVSEVVLRSKIDANKIDEVIIGNVAQPADSANIARIIAMKAGLPKHIPAFTVHRNCASGMEAFTTASSKILNNEAEIILAGGVESMSNIPLFYGKKMTEIFARLAKARSIGEKIAIIKDFRLSMLTPVIGLLEGLTDPISGLIMGCTAENVARDFQITRAKQDEFSLRSHILANQATNAGIFRQEIIAVFNNDENNSQMIEEDEGIRKDQKIEDLQKLKPYFEKNTGTVTVGNSSQITDGACFAILVKESKAKEILGENSGEILGYLSDFAYAGVEPSRMGLGPVFATQKLFAKTKLNFKDIDLIELNEAFSAQVLGCLEAFNSEKFCQENFSNPKFFDKINHEIVNVNGGAIALGHPVGMSGARIIVHLLRELKRRGKNRGLASLCIGGGQGGACIVETC